MAIIAFSVYGTAGDVFPCISIGKTLSELGHEVIFTTPRWLGLYPRQAGFATITIGDGSEKRVLADSEILNTRFDGLDSWRRTMNGYLAPYLASNYDALFEALSNVQPDLIITTALGYWGSVAAVELDVPWTSVHMYPQLYEPDALSPRPPPFRRARRFGGALNRWLVSQEERLNRPSSSRPTVAWSVNGGKTLNCHDPAVHRGVEGYVEGLGYPYWDSCWTGEDGIDQALEFLHSDTFPRVIVSLGSFIGFADASFWKTLGSIAGRVRARFLLLVYRPEWLLR